MKENKIILAIQTWMVKRVRFPSSSQQVLSLLFINTTGKTVKNKSKLEIYKRFWKSKVYGSK